MVNVATVADAKVVLAALGLPPRQQTDIAALSLLVLAGLNPLASWHTAIAPRLRVHDMLAAINMAYGIVYAENSRETIRRQVLHQFVQAGVAIRNPDDPHLPTNSPHAHYALSPDVLEAVRAFGTDEWSLRLADWRTKQPSLLEQYQQQRQQVQQPLIYRGQTYFLSPGAHNQLQVAIINELGPRYAPAATLLYVGDTADKSLLVDKSVFDALGIAFSENDKLPDVMLFDPDQQYLLLIEAVTSHGPISPKRALELRAYFAKTALDLVFVTAFLTMRHFKSFVEQVAWDSYVWIADQPDHLIHFNGNHF